MSTRFFALFASSLTTVLIFGIGTAFAEEVSSDGKFNSVRSSPNERKAIIWTPNQKRSAKPLPLPVVNVPNGKSGKSGKPAPQTPQSAQGQPSLGKARSNNWVPIKWEGKIYFRQGADLYMCSGQFITDDVILTAGHCVQEAETAEWHTDFEFDLQYNDGKATSIHKSLCMATLNGWTNGGEDGRWAWDYAMVKVDKPSTVGHMGYHYNWRDSYTGAKLTGYPKAVADGERITLVNGALDAEPGEPGNDNEVAAHHENPNFTGGSSGGAWIGNYSAQIGKTNYVIGINSYTHPGDDTTMYSPYLTEDFKTLLDYTENGCK